METIKKTDTEIQQEWYNIGETYASEVNKMVAFG